MSCAMAISRLSCSSTRPAELSDWSMSSSHEMSAPIQRPILLRAPDGAEVWTIVELQGSIESKASTTLNGVQFAQLSWESNEVRCGPRAATDDTHPHAPRFCALPQAAPSIIFGKQKAEGCWADLKKPLVVMAKVEGNPCEYHARGVVRRKLVYKARPKPITRPAAAVRKRVRLDGPEAST